MVLDENPCNINIGSYKSNKGEGTAFSYDFQLKYFRTVYFRIVLSSKDH